MSVIYVNKNDEVVGAGSIRNAVDKGIPVRISRVFLLNDKNELLLQKRSDSMTSLPGRWDQTAGGHVDVGAGYETAAYQELVEEMGVERVELHEIAYYYSEETDETKTKKRFNKIFIGNYGGEVIINTEEVADYRWVHIDELREWMQQKPADFPDGFIEAFGLYQKDVPS